MERILYFIFENSIYAAIAMLIVLLVRFLLGKTPKIYSYLLWGVVFFRLLCPVTINTGIGLIPEISSIQNIISHADSSKTAAYEYHDRSEVINDGFSVDTTHSATLNSHYTDTAAGIEYSQYSQEPQPAGKAETHNKSNSVTTALFFIWLSGTVIFLTFYFISLYKVRRKIYAATRVYGLDPHVYESDRIDTSFVFGLIKPRIYIPTWLNGRQAKYVIKHEQVHLRRRDYIIKPLAFIVTAVYWFNPAAWVSYILMCRDMEMSCDETVVRDLGMNSKGEYCKMLYELCPKNTPVVEAAINGSDVKSRIKHTLTYKRPTKIVAVLAALAVVFTFTACVGNSKPSSVIDSADKAPVVSTVVPDNTEETQANEDIYADIVAKPEDYTIVPGEDGMMMIGEYNGSDKIVRIPDSYDGIPVTSIGCGSFQGKKTVETVIIPEGVEVLVSCTFRMCPSLKQVILPSTIREIGCESFCECGSLEQIVLPEGITEISMQCFGSCTSLESIVIPSTVKIIDAWAFDNCTSLKNVVIPTGVEEIWEYAFQRCDSLEEIVIPEGVWSIRECAFWGCHNLKNVVLPSTLLSLGPDVFEGCEQLREELIPKVVVFDGNKYSKNTVELIIPDGATTVTGCGVNYSLESVVIPDSVNFVDSGAFVECHNLKSVSFGKNLKMIGNTAFENCKSLEKIVLPDGLLRIDWAAFYGCSSLKEITIPESVSYIGSNILGECPSDVVIICKENSTAHQYAVENNISFVLQ